MTPEGYVALQEELKRLKTTERLWRRSDSMAAITSGSV